MSDDDLEGAPFNVWFDSEVDFPNISSVSTIPYMGVNVSSPLPTHPKMGPRKTRIAVQWIRSAPNKSNLKGHVPLEEKGPNKGDDLLDSPIHTPPPSKSPSPFSCHVPWLGHG